MKPAGTFGPGRFLLFNIKNLRYNIGEAGDWYGS